MKLTALLLLVFLGTSFAHASSFVSLKADDSDRAAGISVIEKIQLLTDKQIGSVKVASLADGPAANPVTVMFMLESANQQGDDVGYDVFGVPTSFSDDVVASLQGDYLMLKGKQEVVDSSGKVNPIVLKVKIKENGKLLVRPLLVNTGNFN